MLWSFHNYEKNNLCRLKLIPTFNFPIDFGHSGSIRSLDSPFVSYMQLRLSMALAH